MGIGSLARHRSGIDKIKTLKNREYAARGIPFVYSETDDDFEHQPYILKAAPDDSPLTSKSNSLLSIIENNAAPNTDVYRAITFMESPDANCY